MSYGVKSLRAGCSNKAMEVVDIWTLVGSGVKIYNSNLEKIFIDDLKGIFMDYTSISSSKLRWKYTIKMQNCFTKKLLKYSMHSLSIAIDFSLNSKRIFLPSILFQNVISFKQYTHLT